MAKAKIKIIENPGYVKDNERFHVVYLGRNGEPISTSENLPDVASCKKNITSHGKLFLLPLGNIFGDTIVKPDTRIMVDIYRDEEYLKTIYVKY